MNFATLRKLTIPEGEVISIARGAEILWRKQKYKCEVEYLESTGTQWIDTGLRLNQDNKLEMLISHFDTNGNKRTFGSRSSATLNNFSVVSGPVGGTMSIVTDFDNYQNNRLAYVIDGDETLEISISKKKLKINDSEKAVSTYGAFTTPSNAYLFNCSGTYPAGYTSATMRLYYCRIYDNSTLVRDFIPVLDWNDRPCMYDKVTDELFYNQGTGEFAYGEIPTTRLPAEYQEVAYLKSTGTQYIRSGYVVESDYKPYRVKIDFQAENSTATGFLIGSAKTTGNHYPFVIGLSVPSKVYLFGHYGSGAQASSSARFGTVDFEKHTLEFVFNEGVYLDGVLMSETVKQACMSSITEQEIGIFCRLRAGVADISTVFKGKIFGVQFFEENNVLVRDYVPCYRKADGKPGMYDLVTETFFTNAGTGEFLYGENV